MGVFETMDRLLAQSDKAELWADVKRRYAERKEGRSLVSSSGKKQEPLQHQTQLKPKQQRVKKRDQGMEL